MCSCIIILCNIVMKILMLKKEAYSDVQVLRFLKELCYYYLSNSDTN